MVTVFLTDSWWQQGERLVGQWGGSLTLGGRGGPQHGQPLLQVGGVVFLQDHGKQRGRVETQGQPVGRLGPDPLGSCNTTAALGHLTVSSGRVSY